MKNKKTDSEYIWNAAFLTFLIVLMFSTIVYFYIGYVGVSRLSYLDLKGAHSNALQTYAPDSFLFSMYTMTPLYITCAAALSVWVFAAVTGLLERPRWAYRIFFSFFILMGLMIWFYSIF